MRYGVPRMHGAQDSGQLAVPRHGKRRAPDSGEQAEQDTDRRREGPEPDDGRKRVPGPGGDDVAQRCHARRQGVRPEDPSAVTATAAYTTTTMPSASGIARNDRVRRVADLLAERGDAGIAGKGEEQQPRGLQDAVGPRAADGRQVPGIEGAASGAGDDDDREDEQRDRDQDPGQCGRSRDPEVVDRGERDRDEQGDRSRMGRPRVCPSGESHRGTARDLADDEGPAG